MIMFVNTLTEQSLYLFEYLKGTYAIPMPSWQFKERLLLSDRVADVYCEGNNICVTWSTKNEEVFLRFVETADFEEVLNIVKSMKLF